MPANSRYHQMRCVRSCSWSVATDVRPGGRGAAGPSHRRRRRPPADPSAVRSDSVRSTLLATVIGGAASRPCGAHLVEPLLGRARARPGPSPSSVTRSPDGVSTTRGWTCRVAPGTGAGAAGFEHVADGQPRRPLRVGRQRRGHAVHERQKHRLERQIVPLQIERGRPQQHAAVADRAAPSAPARHRRSAR